MKSLENKLQPVILRAIQSVFQVEAESSSINFQSTRKEFAGDITLVCFALTKLLRKKPEVIGEELGQYLKANSELVTGFNTVKGFLNIEIDKKYWISELVSLTKDDNFGFKPLRNEDPAILVEYSSPNTNKPLHLGHIRNILLGYSVSKIIAASGKPSIKVQIINDRGIHICKSMLAWQKAGGKETPESTGLKGDHLVGKYYVAFDKTYKEEIKKLVDNGMPEDEAKKKAPSLMEAQDLLRKWEKNDPETVALWEKMNDWVYQGFDATYNRLGVDFDKNYYESETYLLGKKVVEEGLSKGVFFKKEDGSVWCDLTDEGLDEKLVLRADGTAVYMTQDIGTAIQRFQDFKVDRQVYTVGNEQDYHFRVLFLILQKLGYDWAEKCFHLSYGMVDLPTGKMKSREGTVVDADDLLEEMKETARRSSEELGKLEGFDQEEKDWLFETLGQGALKYFILKVDPKKRMLFNPEESIDFTGNTGPFIQYTHARISSLLKRGEAQGNLEQYNPQQIEIEVVKNICLFPEIIQEAAENYSPAVLSNYLYDLVKTYNQFYQNISIWNDENQDAIAFRVTMSQAVAEIIRKGMDLLGIQVPERM